MRIFFLFCFIFSFTNCIRAEDRALIVGIEQYSGADIRPAHGAGRDAMEMERLLLSKLDFPAAAVHRLDGAQATSAAISREFRYWLIKETRAGDRVFFFYAGHGSYLRDDDGDEKDGYDETIVPYDANRRGPGMIRDDQFARWMSELAGRRVVMVFDSCHSGTITRSFGRGAENSETSRAIIPADSELQPQTRNRVLLELSDGGIGDHKNLSPQSSALIISAAGAMQTAHSMKIEGIWRGALTLALRDAIETVNKDSLPVDRLKGLLKKQIAGWQRTGLLNGSQSPEFEGNAGRLESASLFGEWESIPSVALFNPRSSLKISLEAVDADRRRNALGHFVYFENEAISYRVSTSAPGYLYLLVFSQDPGTKERYVTMLFPNPSEGLDNRLNPPGIRLPEKSEYRIGASGLDLVVALVTTESMPIEMKAKYSWDEIFMRFDLRQLKQQVQHRMRSVAGAANSVDWQGASLSIFTAPRGSR